MLFDTRRAIFTASSGFVLLVLGCGDDAGTSGGGGSPATGASTTTSASTSTDPTTTSDSSSSASSSTGNSSSSAGGGGGGGGDGGAGGTGGAGGGEPFCAPGDQQPCYTGPAGTEGMGLCVGGTATCLDDGTAFGPCEDEVTPGLETCNTAGDDDCDGETNEEGAGCVCTPGSTITCYTGPSGTEGVGTCAPGVATCNDQGTALGACQGEVVPGFDDCGTAEDEDCDGLIPSSCPGGAVWSKRLGALAVDTSGGVTSDSAGNVIAAGSYMAAADFGGGVLTSGGSSDVFLAKYDAAGNHIWSKRFGDVSYQGIEAVTVDGDDNIVIAGYAQGTIDFGGGPLSQVGMYDLFIAKLDASGNFVWNRRFGSASFNHVNSVATDAAGNVIIIGDVEGGANFGGSSFPGQTSADAFVAKYDADGNHVWSMRWGNMAVQYGAAVATDTAGNVLFTGEFAGMLNLPGGTLTSLGARDVFVVKLDPAGSQIWSKRIGDVADQYGNGVAVDDADNVVLTGWYAGTMDFGGGPLTTSGGMDAFLAKYDAAGNHVWSKSFGGGSGQFGTSVATDAAGNVLLAADSVGLTNFGGGTLLNLGSTSDVVLAKYDPAGNHLWSKDFGDLDDQFVRKVAVDPAGNVLLTGELNGEMTFGNGTLTSAGYRDVFVAKLEP